MKKVVGLGAGGHAKVLIEILRQDPGIELMGLLDLNPQLHGIEVSGVKVLGDDSQLLRLVEDGIRYFFVGVGGTGDNHPRRMLYELGIRMGCLPISIVHPSTVVSPSATLGCGVEILAGAIISADAWIGANVIVNTGAIVEHDCVVGDHAHIATGARLSSTVQVGIGAHIGAGATVRQSIRIGAGAIVGAGAVVVKDVGPGVVVAGVPSRPIR